MTINSGVTTNGLNDSEMDIRHEIQDDNHSVLCTNCINQPGCTFRSKSSGPVIHCEEHAVVRLDRKMDHPNTAVKNGSKKNHLVIHFAPRGLCINCLHKTECILPKADGGVWYCEEYE